MIRITRPVRARTGRVSFHWGILNCSLRGRPATRRTKPPGKRPITRGVCRTLTPGQSAAACQASSAQPTREPDNRARALPIHATSAFCGQSRSERDSGAKRRGPTHGCVRGFGWLPSSEPAPLQETVGDSGDSDPNAFTNSLRRARGNAARAGDIARVRPYPRASRIPRGSSRPRPSHRDDRPGPASGLHGHFSWSPE